MIRMEGSGSNPAKFLVFLSNITPTFHLKRGTVSFKICMNLFILKKYNFHGSFNNITVNFHRLLALSFLSLLLYAHFNFCFS